MSPVCGQKLARLQSIVAERAAWADQLTQVKHLHGWLLEVEHLLDASPAQAVVSNATVGSCLDSWREQMARRLSDGTLSEQERVSHRVLAGALQLAALPGAVLRSRGVPAHQQWTWRAVSVGGSTRYRRISGRKNWNA